MKQVTIDGQPGTALWDDGGPLIAFKPHGTTEWRYIDRRRLTPPRATWHTDYEDAE